MDVELGTVVHSYGIVRSDAVLDLPTTGIGGAGVALLDAPPVSAVFSLLPEPAYGAAAWEAHADDPAWLAEVATGHQRVLDGLVRDTDVLPLRLPATYRDEVHLHEFLSSESRLLETVLGAVSDHVEWSVHLYRQARAEEAPPQRPTTGADYLRQRSAALADRQHAQADRERLVRTAYAALADVSRRSVVNRPQDSALTGRTEPMLLNSAHLVNRGHERLFFAAVEEEAARLSPAGISVEVTGPWPPYNFVDLGADRLEVRS